MCSKVRVNCAIAGRRFPQSFRARRRQPKRCVNLVHLYGSGLPVAIECFQRPSNIRGAADLLCL